MRRNSIGLHHSRLQDLSCAAAPDAVCLRDFGWNRIGLEVHAVNGVAVTGRGLSGESGKPKGVSMSEPRKHHAKLVLAGAVTKTPRSTDVEVTLLKEAAYRQMRLDDADDARQRRAARDHAHRRRRDAGEDFS